MKLGAYWWDGWSSRNDNWTNRLMREFASRMPLWGWLDDSVENMERQIDLAADAGLQFFAFDWYFIETGTGPRFSMNDGIDRFLQARNRNRMKQCLLVANHSPFGNTFENWPDFCMQVMPFLTDAGALKTADGKPLLIIFDGKKLIQDLGGAAKCRQCFDILRAQAQEQGLPGLCILSGVWPVRSSETGDVCTDCEAQWKEQSDLPREAGYDAITGYNYARSFRNIKFPDAAEADRIFPFASLCADYELAWKRFTETTSLPYMPCVNAGWDNRPWESSPDFPREHAPQPSCYSPDRTPFTQYRHICNARQWVDTHPDKLLDDFAIIYAWNENGEGGFLTPTISDQGSNLRAVSLAVNGKEFT